MVELTRTVRFCINDAAPPQAPSQQAAHPPAPPGGARAAAVADHGAAPAAVPPRHNTYSAWPAMRGLGRYYELHVRCRGDVDPVTGYFVNIRHIDAGVRDHVLPWLSAQVAGAGRAQPRLGPLMRDMLALLQPALRGSVVEVRLALTPYYHLSIRSDDMEAILIRQRYEFSAAHRLHVPQLSDEENRQVFGKCNNPSGHGHNYHLEVCLRAPIDAAGQCCSVEALDAAVDRAVIQKLDHKHLNLDVPQFRDAGSGGGGLNPSVENIAKVIYDLLRGEAGPLGAELKEVSVWETEKTVCTYGGGRS